MAHLSSKSFTRQYRVEPLNPQFTIAGGKLLRNKWREQNDTLKTALGESEAKVQNKIPENSVELYAWARLDKNPNQVGRSRSQVLLLVDPTSPDVRKQVAVKVYGFARPTGMSLGALGNWSGK